MHIFLVQRERDPIEGPIFHLDSWLCILLSITPLAIVSIIEEDKRRLQASTDNALGNNANTNNHDKENKLSSPSRRHATLHSSLHILGKFDDLLVPPQYMALMANQIVIKATRLV